MHISVNNLDKTIKNRKVLDKINIEMDSGKVYGLQGINGSGKTMLMRAISGLIKPTGGEVIIDDKVIGKNMSFPESIGLLIENPAFISSYSAYENLNTIASIKKKTSKDEIENSISRVGLDKNDKRAYKKYSLGMKQKLGIAAAIMEKPELIILDEPFNALDEGSVTNIKKIIVEEKERGALIILACHNKNDLEEVCDTVFKINNGCIIE